MRAPSYHSSALVVAACVCAFARAAEAKPYEDTRRRFTIELAEGWSLAPAFGEAHGMTFRRVLDARGGAQEATLRVRADPVAAGSLAAFADRVDEESNAGLGVAKVSESRKAPGLVREFKAKDGTMVRAWYAESGGHFYHLRAAAPAIAFRKLDGELAKMVASFVPLAGGGAAPVERAAAQEEGDALPAGLAGRWVNDDGLVLALEEDRRFTLAEASGRFEVGAGELVLIIPGQGRETFGFRLDAAAGTLTLRSPNLDGPMVYRRAGGGAKAAGAKSGGAGGAGGGSPAGRWKAPNGVVVLALDPGGAFEMGNHRGRWKLDGAYLVLEAQGTASVTYRYQVDGPKLTLSGGDLEKPLTLSR